MTPDEKKAILERAQHWFRESVAERHAELTRRLTSASEFRINPFIASYLANFLEGNGSAESIAKALIYPRVLGTSIVTIFGTGIQRFTSEVLGGYGSLVDGIDLEFTDALDGRRKYCQLKAGTNTINKDDVETINQHFDAARRRGRTNNNRKLALDDLVLGVIYGEPEELSYHYRRLTKQYHIPILVGQDFWKRLTGDSDFYFDLIESIGDIAVEANFAQELREVISSLAESEEIRAIAED